MSAPPRSQPTATAVAEGFGLAEGRGERVMYVVMVAPECAPVTYAGGLGEVVFGLSRELEIRGHAVEILLPKYDCMRLEEVYGLCVAYENLWVPWYSGAIPCTVWFGFIHGRKCYFIEPHSADNFFGRGHVYGSDDDVMRYGFSCKAAMEFLLKSGKRPDLIHCHDWQTALVPVLLFELYQHLGMDHQRACLTIHNFRHQGVCGEQVLWATGLLRPEHYFDDTRLRDNFNPGALNLLKGGIVYANFVTTVSPQHAWEALYTDQGMGLGHTLSVHRGKFGGILNGVDYDVWNPEVDQHIAHNYSLDTLDHKYANKQALRERLWLRQEFKPIVAYVGRLDEQKGVHLIQHAISYALARGAQFVLVGSGTTPAISDQFGQLKWYLNDHPDCHLELSYDPELAHLVYAGADLVVMPSLYEPCGLTQLIASRYATVPIVRAIGGLCDTVFDQDYAGRPPQDRNGYVFHQVDGHALESAMIRAIGLWHTYPDRFRELMTNGMRTDYSWASAGQHYLNVYDHVRHK
jgi:starch synthase